MSALDKRTSSLPYTALPIVLLSVLSLAIVHQAGHLHTPPSGALHYEPKTIAIAPRTFHYRADGEYIRGTMTVDPPMIAVIKRYPLTITKYQVTASEYLDCVADDVCKPAANDARADLNLPVTGVSYEDATAYARWLSEMTGDYWRLPSDQELAFAAGSRFPDDASGLAPDNINPALRWIADYEREAAARAARDPSPRPVGSFGENEHGLADFGGNIWEWTSTCHRRVKLNTNGSQDSVETICGINVTVGPHRSPVSSFIRDPRGGGCSVGTPPDNLGFRLVKSTRWYAPFLKMFREG